jgi:ABC-type Fe3+/spermidine/putrescine transport system ATPase subunit
VRIGDVGEAPLGDGSSLEGTIAEIVFLGMYTQFHVDTAAGRVVSHRLAESGTDSFETGSAVALTWPADEAYTLAEPVPAEV